MTADVWRIDVTNADIRVARLHWQAAVDANAPAGEIERRREMLGRLISAQAQQIADDFRAATARATELG